MTNHVLPMPSVNGDRKVGSKEWRKLFGTFFSNGIFPNPSTNLQVFENGNLTTLVKNGTAFVEGVFMYEDADIILQHDIADAVLARIDRVVIRLDFSVRTMSVVLKKGTFSSMPVAPNLQRDAVAYELALADIFISAGAMEITQANITDTRLNNELCGVVHGAVGQVDTTTIFNQYKSWFDTWSVQQQEEFETWLESIKDLLDGDVAANLAQAIGDLSQLNTTDKSSLVNAVNEVNRHTHDFEYQIPIVAGNVISLIRQSDTSRLFFKLEQDLTIDEISISLDDFATSKPLKNIKGVNVKKIPQGFVEVVDNGTFFTYAPKGGGIIDHDFSGLAFLNYVSIGGTTGGYAICADDEFFYSHNGNGINKLNKNTGALVSRTGYGSANPHRLEQDDEYLYFPVIDVTVNPMVHYLVKVRKSNMIEVGRVAILSTGIQITLHDSCVYVQCGTGLYKYDKNTLNLIATSPGPLIQYTNHTDRTLSINPNTGFIYCIYSDGRLVRLKIDTFQNYGASTIVVTNGYNKALTFDGLSVSCTGYNGTILSFSEDLQMYRTTQSLSGFTATYNLFYDGKDLIAVLWDGQYSFYSYKTVRINLEEMMIDYTALGAAQGLIGICTDNEFVYGFYNDGIQKIYNQR